MNSYSLCLLGPPIFQGPTGPIRPTVRKAEALLYYLAAQPGSSFSRVHLASLLWPEGEENTNRNRLNTTLSRLRQSLPIWPIRAEGDMLAWDPQADLYLDISHFISLTRSAGLDRTGEDPPAAESADCLRPLADAAALWRGHLLQGFALPQSPAFAGWLNQERQAWARRMLEVLVRLVRAEEAAIAWDRMIGHCHQALSIDPLQERFYRWLMVAYYQTGDRGAALAQYVTCATVLAGELGAEPDPVTTRLRDQIARGSLPRPPAG